ncbi:MAG: NERD domain-containing protein, partial [Phascolarctobacterium sp.]|nr:NERD domain-containing protein [Phascolarctobacterium sp.]
IKADKATFVVTITSDFYEQNLLSVSSLSNKEKLKAYSDIRDFCCKYIPILSDRGFRVESIHDNYPDYVSEEVCAAFKENWIRINRSYNVLSRGSNGEEKVYEVLRLFDDRIRILRDYVWGHEHDFIVITPYGISTIEVKNLRGKYVLTETGILKCLSSKKVKSKDIALQSKKHLETLRRNLSGCPAFSTNVPLQEIICSAEPNFTIKDNYHYIPICYYNTVDKALLPDNGKVVLDVKAMDAIEKYLLKNEQEAFEFDVFLPRGEIDSRDEFIKNFADVASGFMASQNETNKLRKEKLWIEKKLTKL